MCGIVGYVGSREATPIVLEGLKRLEYRGYDSAGIAVIQDGQIAIRREVGKLANLERLLTAQPMSGQHRHGPHPVGHARQTLPDQCPPPPGLHGQVVLIQNGIVENYRTLRQELKAEGHRFASETDTEVIVHLVERYLGQGMTWGCGAAHPAAHRGCSCDRRDEQPRAGQDRGGPPGKCRRRDGRGGPGGDVHRLRHPGHPGTHPADDPPGKRRDGRRHRGGRPFCDLEGQPLHKQVTTVPWDPDRR